jgi:outer membrane immunogenic protein
MTCKKHAFALILIAAWTAQLSIEANAQSLKDVIPSDTADGWTGIYIGAGGGLNSLVSKISGKPGPLAGEGSEGAGASFDGLGSTGGFGSLSVGADYQISKRWVAGVFGEYDFESLGSSASLGIPDQPLSIHANIDANGKASVGGRLGYLFTPETLWYVSAGYSNFSLSDFRLHVVGSDADVSVTAKTPNLSGGFIGAGAETKITEHISFKAEYRYTDFGSGPVSLPTIDGTNLNDFVSVRVAPSMQEGRASINYRF